jgi:hypothetical protein
MIPTQHLLGWCLLKTIRSKFMKDLKQFLENEDISINSESYFRRSKSEYVHHKNFTSLYIRKGLYRFNNEIFNNAIVIANITAKKRGKGYFSELIKELTTNFPGRPVIIENALNERFQNKLIRMGFEQGKKETSSEDCYLWNPAREK